MNLIQISLVFVLICYPQVSFSYYDNDSYWNTNHEKPAWFEMDSNGGFIGETEDGISFTQYPVINDQSIRLHKFVIGTAFFYISNKGIIKAENDLSAISIYFTLV